MVAAPAATVNASVVVVVACCAEIPDDDVIALICATISPTESPADKPDRSTANTLNNKVVSSDRCINGSLIDRGRL